MKYMLKREYLHRFISILLIAVVLVGFVPIQQVNASDANYMSSAMINFFRDSNDIADVHDLTPEEVQVYAVFITNFMKPGQFTIKDLNGDVNSPLVTQISKFFGSTGASETDKATIVKLNQLVYESITTDIAADGGEKCTLYNSTDATKPLTGKQLLNKMYFYDDGDTDKNELSKTIIYFGPEKAICMDMSKPAIRGSFKILAGYSLDYMVGKNGVANMTALYIDGFGNIWGAYNESFAVNDETTINTTTSTTDLKLVMPACINPLSFTSFASSTPTQDDLKLPLNNAFAMGAFINTADMNNNFLKNIAPYYNLYGYFGKTDMKNLLNIYGLSSPLSSIGSSNSAHSQDFSFDSKLTSFFGNKLNTIYKDSTYIMLANNIKIVNDSMDTTMQEIKGITSKTKIIEYLYGSMSISLTDVADTLYYFDDGGEDWNNTTFADLGLMGASLFTNDQNTFYSANAKINGITNKLSDFYGKLAEEGIDISSIDATQITYENVDLITQAAKIMKDVLPATTNSKVAVTAKTSTYDFVCLLGLLNNDFSESNFNKVKDSKDYKNAIKAYKNYGFADDLAIYTMSASGGSVPVVYDMTPYISAVLYLIGASVGECNNEDYGSDMYNFYAPSLFKVGYISKDNKADKKETSTINEVPYYYGLEDADQYSYTPINSDDSGLLGWLFDTTESSYIYSLCNHYDGAVGMVVAEEGWYGEFTTPNGPNQFFTNFNVYTLFSSHNISLTTSLAKQEVTAKVGSKDVVYRVNTLIADDTNNWPGIFFGYMVDILQMDIASKKATEKAGGDTPKYDCYSFESDFLPSATINVTGGKLDITTSDSESGVSTSDEQTMKEMQEDLVKKIYGIVSDTSNDYRNQWLKSTIDGLLLTIHRNITGSWLSNMYTISSGSGSTYQGVVGYIYTPSLNDLPFTAWFMTNYMQIYAFMLLLIAIALVLMVLLRIRTWRQGSAIFMFMCIALLLPNILLGNTINITNKFTDGIYSDKFDFWAMTQHQQALTSLSDAKTSKEKTIAATFQQAEEMYSSDAGVRIKWMSPKKSSVFNSLYTNTNMSESFATNLTIFKWLFSSFIYESDYVDDDPLATYLYRSYNSIAKAGKDDYEMSIKSILKKTSSGTPGTDGSDAKVSKKIAFVDKNGDKKTSTVETYSYIYDIYKLATKSERSTEYAKMFYGALVDDKLYTNEDNFMDIYYGGDTDSGKLKDINAVDTYNKTDASDSVALWGLGSEALNKVMFTKAEAFDMDSGTTIGVESTLDNTITDITDMSDANTAAFLLNTESPYYYFYNTLKYRYGSNNDFKGSLLNTEIYKIKNIDFESTSVSANGSVRDFLDLEGLFTYMIPYLSVCNDYVYDWTSINGTKVDAFDFQADGVVVSKNGNEAVENQYIKAEQLKKSMQQVWNMYCPWVDQLNALDVHNEKVKIGTKTVRIQNTLNPSYYLLEGRPMIFSEADMLAKGYRISDLTDTERRIQNVLEETYTDLMYLVNYYDMDNEVLLSAAAMYATFNFNKEFSQTNVIGESVRMYPQNFEMKNFNHDAFLRLALLNSTGETVFSDTDLFETVLNKTSIFTGLLLLIEDVLAIIAIPALKFIILLMLLFLGLLICVSCVISPPEKIVQLISKTFVLPTMLFMLATIIFSWLVAMLVGDGLTSYVGSQNMSIATNDPTITILLLIVMDVIYVIVMLKLVKMMFESCKSLGMASVFASIGLVTGALTAGAGAVTNKIKNMGSRAGGTVGGAIVGGLMNGKGGIIDGAMDGASGRSMGSIYAANKREKRGAEQYAKAMGMGKDVGADINAKASQYTDVVEPQGAETKGLPKSNFGEKLNGTNGSTGGAGAGAGASGTSTTANPTSVDTKKVPKVGLDKEGHSANGSFLGNRLEDLAYFKNKAADSINAAKHTAIRTADKTKFAVNSAVDTTKSAVNSAVDTTKAGVTKARTYAGATITSINQKGSELGRKVGNTASNIASGQYYNDAVKQMKDKNATYQNARTTNDIARSMATAKSMSDLSSKMKGRTV